RWIPSVDPTESAGNPIPRRAGELVLIILNPSMVRQKALPDEVLGTADVARRAAARWPMSCSITSVELLARPRCISSTCWPPSSPHDLGHLLLQVGSHSREGLMRAFWSIRAFTVHNPQETAFTSAQGDDIRRAIRRRTGDQPNRGSD